MTVEILLELRGQVDFVVLDRMGVIGIESCLRLVPETIQRLSLDLNEHLLIKSGIATER